LHPLIRINDPDLKNDVLSGESTRTAESTKRRQRWLESSEYTYPILIINSDVEVARLPVATRTITRSRFAAVTHLLAASVAALCLLAPATTTLTAARATLPILVYHQIRTAGAEPPDGDTAISLARFTEEMQWLHDAGYTPLSMAEVVGFMQGTLTPAGKPVAIHVDDGWKSGLATVPILDRFGFKASFWIIAGTGISWPHVDWPEVDALAANPRIDIFSHTMTHPWKPGETLVDWVSNRTAGRSADDAARELADSKRILEARLHRPVPYLAWPSGFYNDQLIAIAQRAGYTALLTIDDGVNGAGGDLLRIHRTMVHGGCSLAVFKQILNDGLFRTCAPPLSGSPASSDAR